MRGEKEMAFFEQIGKRLIDAGQNVAQQTKNLTDVTQLNSAISESEKKVSQLFLNIGHLYYEVHKDDLLAENRGMIDEINALYAEILENREKIKQIKGITKCAKCGADVPLNVAFCSSCGAKIERENDVNEKTEDVRYCPVCHSAVDAEDSFCNHCGTKIEQD